MKKIIFTILALVVLSLALSAQVVFKESKDSSSNIQGTIHVYDSLTGIELSNAYITLTVILYYNIDENGNREVFQSADLITDENGNYAYDFIDQNGNSTYCDLVEVIFRGCHYTADYDGIVRIDIDYHGEVPNYPPTDPEND